LNQLDSDEELPESWNSCGSRKAFLSLFSFYYGEAYRLAQKADFIVIAPTVIGGEATSPHLDLWPRRLVLEGKAVLILERGTEPCGLIKHRKEAAQEKLKKNN